MFNRPVASIGLCSVHNTQHQLQLRFTHNRSWNQHCDNINLQQCLQKAWSVVVVKMRTSENEDLRPPENADVQ